MAFIELTEDEFDLLSETEKRQYNRQLKLHRERVAFVEKLEQIENADYQYKKPQVKRIKPIRRIELPQYEIVKKVSLVMPMGLMKSKRFNEKTEIRRSINSRTREKLRSQHVVANVPFIKRLAPISTLSFDEKKKLRISDVSKTRCKITAPTLKFRAIGENRITSLPKKKISVLPYIPFEYNRKPVKVKKVKAYLPRIAKFSGNNDISIKNVPSVFVGAIPKKQYSYKPSNEQSILDVKEKVNDAKINAPQLLFNYARKSVKITKVKTNLPQITKFTGDYSSNIKDVPSVSVGAIPKRKFTYKPGNDQSVSEVIGKVSAMKVKAPMLSFETPIIDIKAVPKIRQIGKTDASKIGELKERILNSEFIRINQKDISVSVPSIPNCKTSVPIFKGVSVPALKKYKQPAVAETIINKPQNVQVPTLEIQTPDYTENHVENVMNRIMKGMQGA